VENFRELKESLEADGHSFSSETDAEVVVHLIERHYTGDLVDAVSAAYSELEGHFAFVVVHREHPEMLVSARLQCPLVVGIGEGEMFLASSIAAFLRETRRVQLIEDGEVVAITKDGARFYSVEDGPREREPFEVDWDDEAAEKHGYETFMLKEIYEQPQAVADTIGDRIREGRLELEEIGLTDLEIQNLRRMVVLATGTAYHAGVVGRYVIEEWARLPCEPDIASEWRYRNPVLTKDTLVVGVSQSGETRDTIHALRLARESGARTIAITNMMGTQITQEVERVLYTRAGIEMAVAATKTFTAQVTLLYLLALKLAEIRNTLPPDEIQSLLAEVDSLPRKMATYLDGDHPIEEIAQRHHQAPFFLYLGRHIGLPVSLEGALKLKEISYIPTEAYSAGEMKHGPIALLDSDTPVVCVATDSHVYDKVVSNIQEVRARGAEVIAIATDGNEDIQHHADDVVYVPRTHPFLQAALAVIPLQLLAYRIARLRGLNVDQPRNLAKTVTVE
jgi:glucosamine--fructose-6-phosphate aminotransferase (isomerizing)